MVKYNIGAYIGKRVLKCVAVKIQKGRKEVYCKSVDYFENDNYTEEIFRDWVMQKIKEFIRKNKLRNYTVYASYDMDAFIMEIGNLSEKEAEQSLLYSIQEKLNVQNTKSIKYKWMYTESMAESNSALVSVVSNKIFDAYADETIINSIEGIHTTMARLIADNKEPVVIVSLQKSNISVTLFKNGMPVHMDSMKVDEKEGNMTANYLIDHKFDLSNIEVNKGDTENANSIFALAQEVDNGLNIQFNHREMQLEPIVSEIMNFIRRSIFSVQMYFENRAISTQISKVYYTYDETMYDELLRYIIKDAEIEFKPFLDYEAISLRDYFEEGLSDYIGHEHALALAYTEKDIFTLKEMVFLRANHLVEKLLTRINIGLVAGLIIIAGAMSYYNVMYSDTKELIDEKAAEMAVTLRNKQNELNNYSLVNPDDLNMDILLSKLGSFKNYNLDVLSRLKESVIKSIGLTDVIIGKNLQIEGVSKSYSDIGYFAIALEKTYNVKINDIQIVETDDKVYTFKLIADLNRPDYDENMSYTKVFNPLSQFNPN